MKKSIFSYFIFYVLLISFISILYIAVDSSFRRKIIGLSIGFFNNYYSITIENSLVKENNLDKAIKKLERQISISDYLTTKSKNSFIDNIYINAYKIEKLVNSQEDYKKLSKVISKIIAKDPNIYSALLWEAKLMKINNFENEIILDKIDQAINLSPSRLEAYRLAFDLSYDLDDRRIFDQYCFKYRESILGGKNEKNNFSFFESSSLSRFAIQIPSKNNQQEFYLKEGIALNQANDYVFTLKNPSNLNEFNFVSNFLPGTSLDLIEINITNKNNLIKNISFDKIYLSSKNSFFQIEDGKIKIITVNINDELIKVRLDKDYKDITKITQKIEFSKLKLTNQKCN